MQTFGWGNRYPTAVKQLLGTVDRKYFNNELIKQKKKKLTTVVPAVAAAVGFLFEIG